MPTTRNQASSASKDVNRRKSIHRDETDMVADNEKEELKQCQECGGKFLVKGQMQTPLTEEHLKDWNNLEKNKSNTTPKSEEGVHKIYPFICNRCAPPSVNKDSQEGQSGKVTEKKSSAFSTPLLIFIGVIAILFGHFTLSEYFTNKEKPFDVNIFESSKPEKYLETQIYSLENIFKSQEDEVWYTLVAGIKRVTKVDPNQPAVFMLLYDNNLAENTATCVAKAASKAAIKYLMHNEKEPVMYTGVDLNTPSFVEDSGRLLVSLNRTVREKGAMVVTKLQEISPEVAKSLHFVCDAYSPLIEKAVYFFTLKVDNIPKYKKTQVAENKLKELWEDHMEDSSVSALITRLTSNVVGIKSDSSSC